jgi:hypothetical protein
VTDNAVDELLAQASSRVEVRPGDANSWWERQLDLSLIGMMATFGWEKALGDEAELRWWERRVGEAARRQGLAHPVGSE